MNPLEDKSKTSKMKFLVAALLALSVGFVLGHADVASAQSGLTVSKLDARLSQGPDQPKRLGLLNLTGLVNDNSTDGQLIDDLIAGTVVLQVDAGTGFLLDVTISGCTALVSHPGARCKADLPFGTGRYKFQARRYRNSPNVFRIDFRGRRLAGEITGSDVLAGPATATLIQTGATRVDTLDTSECTAQRSGGFLKCRAE